MATANLYFFTGSKRGKEGISLTVKWIYEIDTGVVATGGWSKLMPLISEVSKMSCRSLG